MSRSIDRRSFLVRGSAIAAALTGPDGCWAIAPPADNWAFPVIGDLHLDRPEHHDLSWVRQAHGDGDVRQIENYCHVTANHTPALLAAVKRAVIRSDCPVPFAVQVGDLVEGLCGSADLATRHVQDAVKDMDAAALGVPLLMTKGNHDITGPGAAEAYDKLLVPWMARQAGERIDGAAFPKAHGGALLAFYDAYARDSLDWFAALLRDRRPERLIVVVHPPVVPYNARAHWHLYVKDEARRQRFLDLLGKYRAVVLGGHLHKFSALTRRTANGAFAQLAVSSVTVRGLNAPKDVRSGVEAYTPSLTELEPNHSPDTLAARKATLAAERPMIEQFDYADSFGFAWVRVGERVTAEVFHGPTDVPWKALDLTPQVS